MTPDQLHALIDLAGKLTQAVETAGGCGYPYRGQFADDRIKDELDVYSAVADLARELLASCAAEQAAFARGAERQREADAKAAAGVVMPGGYQWSDNLKPWFDIGKGRVVSAILATPLVTEES